MPFFPENVEDVNDEHEKMFHHDIASTRLQVDFYLNFKWDTPEASYKTRNTKIKVNT